MTSLPKHKRAKPTTWCPFTKMKTRGKRRRWRRQNMTSLPRRQRRNGRAFGQKSQQVVLIDSGKKLTLFANTSTMRLICMTPRWFPSMPLAHAALLTYTQDSVMPNPDYMDGQNEITWAMRQTLVDWLLQVHLRYHMLPETLWIAVNIVDRFLTKRVVSLVKLQLVGVTAMFIAAKYEEILAPSVEEFAFMTENGYTKEEILKGERIMLQTLEFRISHYCSPYSWMRKISKADDYDLQTRTLSKFLTEVTLLDHRFLRVKPSLVAAVGMYCARRMLQGDWTEAFVYHSGYTEEQLLPGFQMLVEKLAEDKFGKQYVCKKYANKKFLKASVFAVEWAESFVASLDANEMLLSE